MGWEVPRAGASWSATPLQVRVGQPEVLLDGLEPGTDYDVWVQSLQETEASEARGIRARTGECPAPTGCRPPGKCPALAPPKPSTRWRAPDPSGGPWPVGERALAGP